MNDTISVIIPVYNTEKYLEKCVDSVINQTYASLEIILVNDGSTDSSPKICDRYAELDNRIKVVHKKNGGLSSARNAGLEAATGNYIGFIDSDDYITPDMYETLYSLAESSDVLPCTLFAKTTEDGEILPLKTPHINGGITDAKEYLRELLLHTGDVSACTKLFPAEVIKTIRFNEDKLNEDLLFMIEIIPHIKKVAFANKTGYFYLSRTGSISSGYGKAIEDMAINSVAVKKFVNKNYPLLKSEANRFALFQNMCYLLAVPSSLRSKENINYVNAKAYVKAHFIKEGLFNPYLSPKNKAVLMLQFFSAGLAARIFQNKKR